MLYQAGLFEAFRRNYDGAVRLLASATNDPAMRPQALRALAFAHGQKRDFPKAIDTARKLVAEPQIGRAEAGVQLDENAVAEVVIDAGQELDLAEEVLDRLLVPSLQRGKLAEAHRRADDEHAFLT